MEEKKSFYKTVYAKIIFALLGVIMLFFAFYFMFIYTENAIAKGVSINGVDIGGKTVQDAKNALSVSDIDSEKIITISSDSGESIRFTAGDINLVRDLDLTVNTAYKLGHDGNFFKNIAARIALFFSPENLNCAVTCDTDKLGELLYGFGVSVNGELNNYILSFGDGFVDVQKGTSGQSRDVSVEVETVIDSFMKNVFDISMNPSKTNPPEPDIDSLYNEISIEPVNASYEIKNGEVIITPEVIGRRIDKIDAGTKIENLKRGEVITLNLISAVPEVTVESINNQLFSYTLGQYGTVYSTSNRNRCSNLELAASRINGIILAPGSVFSYNETVGKRSADNGFKSAPMYENGETVEGLGGGVCQVSSTLYSAVLYADLEVLKRQSHSMTVGYVPKGQDATVSYGTIDFQFKNNTDYPIKIIAYAYGGKVNVSIVGTKPEIPKTVKIENIVQQVQEPTIESVQDNSLATGKKKVLSPGKTGYVVSTVRHIYENGVEKKSEKMGKSIYKMVPTKVAIGAKVPAPLPPLPPLETEETQEQVPEDAEAPEEAAE